MPTTTGSTRDPFHCTSHITAAATTVWWPPQKRRHRSACITTRLPLVSTTRDYLESAANHLAVVDGGANCPMRRHPPPAEMRYRQRTRHQTGFLRWRAASLVPGREAKFQHLGGQPGRFVVLALRMPIMDDTYFTSCPAKRHWLLGNQRERPSFQRAQRRRQTMKARQILPFPLAATQNPADCSCPRHRQGVTGEGSLARRQDFQLACVALQLAPHLMLQTTKRLLCMVCQDR